MYFQLQVCSQGLPESASSYETLRRSCSLLPIAWALFGVARGLGTPTLYTLRPILAGSRWGLVKLAEQRGRGVEAQTFAAPVAHPEVRGVVSDAHARDAAQGRGPPVAGRAQPLEACRHPEGLHAAVVHVADHDDAVVARRQREREAQPAVSDTIASE